MHQFKHKIHFWQSLGACSKVTISNIHQKRNCRKWILEFHSIHTWVFCIESNVILYLNCWSLLWKSEWPTGGPSIVDKKEAFLYWLGMIYLMLICVHIMNVQKQYLLHTLFGVVCCTSQSFSVMFYLLDSFCFQPMVELWFLPPEMEKYIYYI